MTRWSELYQSELEAKEKAERTLAAARQQQEVLNRFVSEHGLASLLAEWSTGAEAYDVMGRLERYRAALELIAGSSQDRLHMLQAKAALDNIGANVASTIS